MDINPVFSDDYLLSRWATDFEEYVESGTDERILNSLLLWTQRERSLTETQTQNTFVKQFFCDIWGYWGSGVKPHEEGFCLSFQHGVDGAGLSGGMGQADLALGWWGKEDTPPVPQTLCEFKDIRSNLDAPQNRKGNDRSPVKQCFAYLKHAYDKTEPRSTIQPTWGIVTNMNEFRLYFRKLGDSHFQRFVIEPKDNKTVSLIGDDEAAQLQRFLFRKLFHRDCLLASFGKSPLEKIYDDQWIQEKALEKDFYRDYQRYRETVYRAILNSNPDVRITRGGLVRLTQRFLDRCIFILFCEDMGKALDFPTDLIRDMLIAKSRDQYYDPQVAEAWNLVKRLFNAMRHGGPFPPEHEINRFNGGLFEELPELENLHIPNHVFCRKGQAESREAAAEYKETLLYLATHYNFGAHGAMHERTVNLYTLGRIFEQSITELEYMEAEAEGKESIASMSKRKRDGVYYTPEWVTARIVQETIGAKLADIREDIGFTMGAGFNEKTLKAYRAIRDGGSKAKRRFKDIEAYISKLDEYEQAVSSIKVLDPACGSGAFLIQALQFLLKERRAIADERARITGTMDVFDEESGMRSVLAQNLYGVDINPESVEITQLALWLHTALPGKPLSNLDSHIRCGNSLVGPDFESFFNSKYKKSFFEEEEREREKINMFDWNEAFPEVFGPDVPKEKRGFDCVIGNPPYVKLQNFRKIKPDESDYYIEKKTSRGNPVYESAQTGNFDLYLPFIEKGISLMNDKGRMGYIAPSLWLKNEYGIGLRRKVKRLRCLDRWIDFKSYQVFEEATTYTALQFFSGSPVDRVRFFLAPDGEIPSIDWDEDGDGIAYSELPDDDAWNLQYKDEYDLIRRLHETCASLEQSCVGITVGIQTSADYIYHLVRNGDGRYFQKGSKADGVMYEIEDEIMHPLVSGPDAKRFQVPDTEIYLLFPYTLEGGKARLFTEEEMRSCFPKAWAYLQKHENELRSREKGKMDKDNMWWGYNYPKNLDKQEFPKLIVPRLVMNLNCVVDDEGEFYLDNVDVGGVIPSHNNDIWFLCGMLNGPVCNFVFRRLSKPFRGEYLSANKQYIAPLPIPTADDNAKQDAAERARELQRLHTARRDKVKDLNRRLDSSQCENDKRHESWIWAEIKNPLLLKDQAPDDLKGKERTAWAKERHQSLLNERLEKIDELLKPGAVIDIIRGTGEISISIDGITVATVYLNELELSFVAAQWSHAVRNLRITDKFEGKKFLKLLLNLRKTEHEALRDQVVDLDQKIIELDKEIEQAEREMNNLIYSLYDLTDDEIRLVEQDGI